MQLRLVHRARALTLLLGLAAAACGDSGFPETDTGERFRVERPSFDGVGAFEDVERQVAFGPRIPGTEGHARQLEWMSTTLRELADTLVLDTFDQRTSGGETLRLTNVLARFRPDHPDRLLFLTHWDTRPRSDQAVDPAERELPVPGANDGASGTAVLLGLAALLAETEPPIGVDLLFVDGEDYGPGTQDMFFGSRRFAASDSPARNPRYAVLLDMVGDRDASFPIEGYSAEFAPQVAQRVWTVAAQLGYGRSFPNRVTGRIQDDHVPLNQAGIPTVDVIDFEYGPDNLLWHTPRDTPDQVSVETLRMVGELVAELVYRGL